MTRFAGCSGLFCILVLVLAGCGASSTPEVVVYVAVDRSRAEPILKQFEEDSGIRVRTIYDAESAKTTGLVTRIMAESAHPRCDVFWNNELVQTLLLADRQLLEPYSSAAAADIPAELRDPTGVWTAVAQRARVIVYNTRYISADEAPQSIFELTKPRWRSQVAVANPQFGTTRTHVAALFAALGESRAEQFLDELIANDVRIVDGNAMVKNLVARAQSGSSPIYVGLTDTDDVLAGQADGEPVAMIFPDQNGLGALIIPSSVCLIRGAPNASAGRKLIDHLVSAKVELQLTAGPTGYLPVRSTAGVSDRGVPIRPMQLRFPQVYEHLQTSSRYTQEHFRP